jgi:hypothetical protein
MPFLERIALNLKYHPNAGVWVSYRDLIIRRWIIFITTWMRTIPNGSPVYYRAFSPISQKRVSGCLRNINTFLTPTLPIRSLPVPGTQWDQTRGESAKFVTRNHLYEQITIGTPSDGLFPIRMAYMMM